MLLPFKIDFFKANKKSKNHSTRNIQKERSSSRGGYISIFVRLLNSEKKGKQF